jgi:hypothetical protein
METTFWGEAGRGRGRGRELQEPYRSVGAMQMHLST